MKQSRLLASLLLATAIFVVGVKQIDAAFNASPVAWTSTYELDPTATDPVSQGDDHLRQNKLELRQRLETEIDFGEIGNVTTDTGRLLEGAGRAFVASAAPTIDGTISATCLAEADYDGNRGCDEGRIWCDTDDDKCYFAEDTGADGDADVWTPFVANITALTASRAVVSDGSGVLAAATTTATEIGYVNGVTSAIQTQLNAKAPLASPTFTGTITTPLTASRAVATGASNELAVSATTATELGYVSGVTSAIQTQINSSRGLGPPLASYTTTGTACTNITSIIDATVYRSYYVEGVIRGTTDGFFVLARTDSDNGASFDAGASDYVDSLTADTTQSFIAICPATNNNYFGCTFGFTIETWAGFTLAAIRGTSLYEQDVTGLPVSTHLAGFRNSGPSMNAITICVDTGVTDVLKIAIYGFGRIS